MSFDDASYICDACGEEVVIPVDFSQGTTQEYVEDCPVCCNASLIHVEITPDGDVHIWAEPEQDRY
ncbi:MAG: CPXCG motif-containing cysteine-rich protein [Planctomycetaceae bacterium]